MKASSILRCRIVFRLELRYVLLLSYHKRLTVSSLLFSSLLSLSSQRSSCVMLSAEKFKVQRELS